MHVHNCLFGDDHNNKRGRKKQTYKYYNNVITGIFIYIVHYPVRWTAQSALRATTMGFCKVKKKFQKSENNLEGGGGSRSHLDKKNWKIVQK